MLMHNPPHPGRILAENFDAHCTVADAARKMGVPEPTITAIIEGKASIMPELALAGIFPAEPPGPWLSLPAD